MTNTNEQRNEESQRKALEEIVLYNGSLEELNSRDLNKQYTFAKEPYFMSEFYEDKPGTSRLFSNILAEKNYAGLVNMRTITSDIDDSDKSWKARFVAIEGTPIVRKDEGLFSKTSKEEAK